MGLQCPMFKYGALQREIVPRNSHVAQEIFARLFIFPFGAGVNYASRLMVWAFIGIYASMSVHATFQPKHAMQFSRSQISKCTYEPSSPAST